MKQLLFMLSFLCAGLAAAAEFDWTKGSTVTLGQTSDYRNGTTGTYTVNGLNIAAGTSFALRFTVSFRDQEDVNGFNNNHASALLTLFTLTSGDAQQQLSTYFYYDHISTWGPTGRGRRTPASPFHPWVSRITSRSSMMPRPGRWFSP